MKQIETILIRKIIGGIRSDQPVEEIRPSYERYSNLYLSGKYNFNQGFFNIVDNWFLKYSLRKKREKNENKC